MCNRGLLTTTLAVGTMSFSGCLTSEFPHNDVMVFGTTTSLGISISADVQNAAIPSFVIGYDRNEAVWMPLKMNGAPLLEGDAGFEDAQAIMSSISECFTAATAEGAPFHGESHDAVQLCMQVGVPGQKYVGMATVTDTKTGKTYTSVDTYAVFASFGARGGGKASITDRSTEASGGLAQFFATGIAAQRLAENETVGLALNAAAPAAKVAEAEAKKAEAESASPVKKISDLTGLPEEDVQKIIEEEQAKSKDRSEKEGLVKQCFKNNKAKLTGSGNSQIKSFATNAPSADVFIAMLNADTSGALLAQAVSDCQ